MSDDSLVANGSCLKRGRDRSKGSLNKNIEVMINGRIVMGICKRCCGRSNESKSKKTLEAIKAT